MRTVILLLLIGLISSGCAYKFTHEKVKANLSKGKTTKQEVLALFGEPDRKYMNPGMKTGSGEKEHVLNKPFEVWLYSLHQSKLIYFLDPEQLRILFDSDSVVSNYYFESDGD